MKLLQSAMEGAVSAGARENLLHLCDYKFGGCISCFRCRRKPTPCIGCGLQDDLQPILRACYEADAIILATPVYFANYPSAVRAFMERLLYHYPHEEGKMSTYKPVRLLYSMNATEKQAIALNYKTVLGSNEDFFRRHFLDVETVWAYNTYQFPDYAQYVHSNDVAEKERARDEDFPVALKKAWKAGMNVAKSCMNRVDV